MERKIILIILMLVPILQSTPIQSFWELNIIQSQNQ